MRAATRKFRRGRSDCLIPAQKNGAPLIFDGLEYRKQQALQARKRKGIVLVSGDAFLCHALRCHLFNDRPLFIISRLNECADIMNHHGLLTLIIDLNGVAQPLISILQTIRRLTRQQPLLRITLLGASLPPALARLIAISTPCALIDRRLPVDQLFDALQARVPTPPDVLPLLTPGEWYVLQEMSHGKSLALITQTMNKPYHHGSYLVTRLICKLGFTSRAQLIYLLHQISLPLSPAPLPQYP